jgi:hypothetical protein
MTCLTRVTAREIVDGGEPDGGRLVRLEVTAAS